MSMLPYYIRDMFLHLQNTADRIRIQKIVAWMATERNISVFGVAEVQDLYDYFHNEDFDEDNPNNLPPEEPPDPPDPPTEAPFYPPLEIGVVEEVRKETGTNQHTTRNPISNLRS